MNEPAELALTNENYKTHEEYKYGIDLFHKGYFWESHVFWEAAWNGCGRKGATADFLKALILLAAGELKLEIGSPKPALGHYKRCLELLNLVDSEFNQEGVFGIKIKQLIQIVGLLSSHTDHDKLKRPIQIPLYF